MSQRFKITDESNDRKYFTLVPNYIINHSSHYEQSLYLVMKRLAGEQGTCFATQLTMANIMKCSQPTVSRSIDYLVSHKWIKCIGTRPGKTRPVKEYKIVDIWKKNMDFYNKDVFIQNESNQKTKDRQTTEYKIGKPQNIEEEPVRRRTLPKGNGKSKTYGNTLVNYSLEKFRTLSGFTPTDRKPRWEANNLIRRITTALKEKGKPTTEEYIKKAVDIYFDWIFEQDWSDNIQTMGVVRRKLPVYLARG